MIAHLKGNAVAYLALFVALGGVSWAAVQLPKNSVRAKQIAKNAVRSGEVKDRSLRAKDFRRDQLPAGPRGEQGPKGDKGDPGVAGAPFAAVQGALDPAPTPDDSNPFGDRRFEFNLPSQGRVVIEWHGGTAGTCSSGVPQVALYLDGVGLPRSARDVRAPGPATEELTLTALTAPIAAGGHVATVQADCVVGTPIGLTLGNGSMWSVLQVAG